MAMSGNIALTEGSRPVAHKANDDDLTLREAALQSGYIDAKRFDEIVDPKKLVGNGLAGA
jgi:fumarate hydratase class II